MMSRCFVIFALILVFTSGLIGLQAMYERDYFIAELIHRDSPISPFYNSSKTTSEYLREAVMRSISRTNFNSSLPFGEKGIVSQMNPNVDEYLMKIYIGFHERLVMASTGSGFTWIQCDPCNDCYEQDVPPFVLRSVNSYEEIAHDSQECDHLPNSRIGLSHMGLRRDICEYVYSYNDEKLETRGILSRANFHLDSSNNQGVKFFPLLFGCCHQTRGIIFDSRVQGMAGLGHGDLSLIAQLEKKFKIARRFSYCLLPITTNRSTKLIFGKEAKFPSDKVSIPFKTKNDSPYYYLTLRHVSVEGKNTIALHNRDNMIIDSGIAVTSLEPTLFDEMSSLVQNFFDGPILDEDPLNRPFKVCYRNDDFGYNLLPDIILYFDGGRITLEPKNTFKAFDDHTTCMMIVPTTKDDRVGVLGNWAQVNFQVEYNLKDEMITFAATDCTKFEI